MGKLVKKVKINKKTFAVTTVIIVAVVIAVLVLNKIYLKENLIEITDSKEVLNSISLSDSEVQSYGVEVEELSNNRLRVKNLRDGDIAVFIIKEYRGKTRSNSYVIEAGKSGVIPLLYGNGIYTYKIGDVKRGSKIVKRFYSGTIKVTKSSLKDFIESSYYTEFSNSNLSAVITIINELELYRLNSDYLIAMKLYDYMLNEIDYDTEFGEMVLNGEIVVHKPDLYKIYKTKRGICIDKASMMVTVLRYLDIPSRIVTGFNHNDNYHSWVEVYIKGKWLAFDPTVGKGANFSKYRMDKFD